MQRLPQRFTKLSLVGWFFCCVLITSCAAPEDDIAELDIPVPTQTAERATATPVPPSPVPLYSAEFVVERGSIRDSLALFGQAVPQQSTLSFPQDGAIRRIMVQVGQEVRVGDLVAELDSQDLVNQLSQAELDAKEYQQSMAQTNQAGQIQIQKAQIVLEGERAKLAELKSPPTALEISQAETKVRQAETSLQTTKNTVSQAKNLAHAEMNDAEAALNELKAEYAELEAMTRDAKKLAEADKTAQQVAEEMRDLEREIRAAETRLGRAVIEFDTARNNEVSAVQEGEAALAVARVELETLLSGPTAFQIAEQERAVRNAELNLQDARRANQVSPSLLKNIQANQQLIKNLKEQIEDRRLYSSIEGEVLSVHKLEGEVARANDTIITLINPQQLQLVADTREALNERLTALQRLQLGQAVQISFQRMPDQAINGTISRLPQQQLLPGSELVEGSSDLIMSFPNESGLYRSGDTAQIRIDLGSKENTLWLPREAVSFSPDRAVVFILSDGRPVPIDVSVGIITQTQVEILRGLQEGDTVVIQ
jgi:HlyD family secretion protein